MNGPRHSDILELVERRGYVSIDELALQFGVTPQTIRRDINDLARQGALARQHGGASLASSIANTSYSTRHIQRVAEKAGIGRAVAEYLPDRATLFMSLGTTVEAVANALASTSKTLMVVTNNSEVARIFWTRTSFETFLTGGVVQHRNGGLVGRHALEMVSQFRCDYFISGIGGIEADGTLMDFYDAEIAVMAAMRARSRFHLVVADGSKFGRPANQRLCNITEVRGLFTEAQPPNAIKALAAQASVDIVIAPQT